MNYTIYMTGTVSFTVTVPADSEREALDKATDEFWLEFEYDNLNLSYETEVDNGN